MLFQDLQRPVIFAHRGASAILPENSLAAFGKALEHGADILELDLHLSSDGEPMVFHDADIKRMTGHGGLVSEFRRGQLQSMPLKVPRGIVMNDGEYSTKQLRIPALEELISAFPDAYFNIDFKGGGNTLIRKSLNLLAGLRDEQVLVTASDHKVLLELEREGHRFGKGMSKKWALDFLRSCFFGEVNPSWRGRALQIPPKIFGFALATKRIIEHAKETDLKVHYWTINNAAQARALCELGADGIMTDNPQIMENLSTPRSTTTQ